MIPKKIGITLLKDDIENDRYIEIWNIVFSEFNNDGNGNYTNLVSKNIDTGAGFERLLSILQDVPTSFDTDLFQPIIQTIAKHTPFHYVVSDYFVDDKRAHEIQRYFRIVADHFRSIIFAIADGVIPSNKERGYVLRRLVRRMVVYANKLNFVFKDNFDELLDVLIKKYCNYYYFLPEKKAIIKKIVQEEIVNFNQVLESGTRLLNKQIKQKKTVDGMFIFRLVETHGIPLEIIKDFCTEQQIPLNESMKEFQYLFSNHQKLSKSTNIDIKGMSQQNKSLLKLTVKSSFDRKNNRILSKCLSLFDQDFNVVQQLKGEGYAVFAKTPFYATCGGQQHDVGVIRKDDQVVARVVDVIQGPNLQHIHRLFNADVKSNEKYLLVYDERARLAVQRNHTAEHLLQSTLKKLFSDNIKQEGSFKSAQKATFDFSYNQKLSDNDLQKIEQKIIEIINLDVKVSTKYIDALENIKQKNVLAYFEDQYDNKFKKKKLRLVKIGKFSAELCGGTHTKSTKEIEDFYIKNYYSIGSDKWRIEIITGEETVNKYFKEKLLEYKNRLTNFQNRLKSIQNDWEISVAGLESIKEIFSQVEKLFIPKSIHQLRLFQKEIGFLEKKLSCNLAFIQKCSEDKAIDKLVKLIESIIGKEQFVFYCSQNLPSNVVASALKILSKKYRKNVFVVINTDTERNSLQYAICCNELITSKINCQKIIDSVNCQVNGQGGGKRNFAQGGVKDLDKKSLLKSIFINEIKKCEF